MTNLFGLIKVLLVALIIPAIGFAVSFFILNDINKSLQSDEISDVTFLCNIVRSGEFWNEVTADLQGFCQEVANIVLLRQGSVIAAAIGILIPVIYWLTSIFAGESRKRIALLFPVVLRISVFLIAASVILQGAILTYAAYIGESYVIGRVHIYLIGAIGIGALVGGITLIGAALSFGRKLEMRAIGKVLTASEAEQLFGFVRSIAEKLGAKEPQNIIVGLDPTFYVTNSNIQVLGYDKQITGETLYVSAPLARLLSKEEFASVVGHELGHFRGNDTIYSMRFAPVYAGLRKALGALATSAEEGPSGLAKLPAIAILSYMYELFATNVAKIGRDREHKADEAGAEAGSALALSTALIKVSLYANIWDHARQQNIERLNQGKVASNLSIVFQDKVKNDVDHENIEQIMESTLEQSISHPTDSHPSVSTRLKALGVNADQITKDMLLVPKGSAIHLLDKSQEIEEEITLTEHRLMVAFGVVKPPEEKEQASLRDKKSNSINPDSKTRRYVQAYNGDIKYEEEKLDVKICQKCDSVNDSDDIFCKKCNLRID